MRLNRRGVSIENCRVAQFVFITRLERHAVASAEGLLHSVELRVEDDLLKATHNLIEIVVIFVTSSVVRHFKVCFAVVFSIKYDATA